MFAFRARPAAILRRKVLRLATAARTQLPPLTTAKNCRGNRNRPCRQCTALASHLRLSAICARQPSALSAISPVSRGRNKCGSTPPQSALPALQGQIFSVSPLSSNFSALNIYYGSSDWPAPHKTASGHTQSLEPCHFFVHIALKFTLHIPILACKQRVYPARSSLALNGFPVCLICLSGSLLWKTLHVFGGLY